jgi:3D (Asp-Asp-Asp) domain-containing protein
MIAMLVIHRIDESMMPGSTKVVSQGSSGERDVTIEFTQSEGQSLGGDIVVSRVVHEMHPRIIVSGPAAIAIQMVATAYTGACGGCSGITAIGRPAGYGIVAVDPRVIPLGTHLYIAGYGPAIAGDTGGAIHGNRIDLGFNTYRAAMRFGRREVTVYRLK